MYSRSSNRKHNKNKCNDEGIYFRCDSSVKNRNRGVFRRGIYSITYSVFGGLNDDFPPINYQPITFNKNFLDMYFSIMNNKTLSIYSTLLTDPDLCDKIIEALDSEEYNISAMNCPCCKDGCVNFYTNSGSLLVIPELESYKDNTRVYNQSLYNKIFKKEYKRIINNE